MRVICVSLSLALLLPLVAAGAPYTHAGSIGPGVFAAYAEKRYSVTAQEGETIRATLTWDDEDARLFLQISIPGGSCPITNVGCIADSIMGHELCSTTSEGEGVYSSPQTLTLVAPATGNYRLSVETFASGGATPYALTVAVDAGGSDRVTGPQSFFPGGFNGNPVHCLPYNMLPA